MHHPKKSLLGYLAFPAFSTLLFASCTGAGPSAADGDHADEAVGEAHDAVTPEQCNYFDVNGTVQLCHKTGSTTKPYTIIRVSEQACINAHSAHGDDYVTSLNPSSPLYDPTCSGQGCLAVGGPCDATVPCCDGLTCSDGTCVAPPPTCPCAADPAWDAAAAAWAANPEEQSCQLSPGLRYEAEALDPNNTSNTLAYVFVADLAAAELGEGYGCLVADGGVDEPYPELVQPITEAEFAACMAAAQEDFACEP